MKHVLVTGAAGGMGSSVCGLLAESGFVVFATDSDPGALRRLEQGPGITAFVMDVTRTEDVSRVRTRIATLVDGLDGLVCCAGVFATGPLVEADESEMSSILDINLMGTFRVVKEFFPLVRNRLGRVVLIGSESSRCAMPFNGPYTISKYALQGYADVLRRELMFLGISVATVQPGAIRTPLLERARSKVERAEAGTQFSAQLGLVRRMLAREWDRGMESADVARVIVRALRSRRPRPLYRVGNDPLRVLLGKLPPSWTDYFIRTFLPG